MCPALSTRTSRVSRSLGGRVTSWPSRSKTRSPASRMYGPNRYKAFAVNRSPAGRTSQEIQENSSKTSHRFGCHLPHNTAGLSTVLRPVGVNSSVNQPVGLRCDGLAEQTSYYMEATEMNIGRFTRQFGQSMMGLALLGLCPMGSLAQSGHAHTMTAKIKPLTAAQSELLRTVRQSTAKYKDVAAAKADGYALLFGCVSGPDYGAMGLHYVNLDLVGSGVVDATRPPDCYLRTNARRRSATGRCGLLGDRQ